MLGLRISNFEILGLRISNFEVLGFKIFSIFTKIFQISQNHQILSKKFLISQILWVLGMASSGRPQDGGADALPALRSQVSRIMLNLENFANLPNFHCKFSGF